MGTCCGSFLPFLFSPKFYVSLYVEFYNGAQLWLAHALTIPVFSVSSGWLCLLQQVSCLLCVIFFPAQLFLHSPAFPCCLKPHLPFPVSCSLSVSICLCLLTLCPDARRLDRLVFPVYSTCFLTRSKEKKIFPLSFPFSLLCCCRPFVLSFDCPRGATKTVGSS